jgi:hypothetical protein
LVRSSVGLFTLLTLAACGSPPSKGIANEFGAAEDQVGETLNCKRLVHRGRPVYPKEAKRKPIEGTVTLRAAITKTGETAPFTGTEGAVTVFAAFDHCTAEFVGIHAVKKTTRFEALEPVRQGVNEYCGGFSAGAAAGLKLRHKQRRATRQPAKVRPAGRFTKGQSVAPAGGTTEFHGYHYRERTADVAATITDYTRPIAGLCASRRCL